MDNFDTRRWQLTGGSHEHPTIYGGPSIRQGQVIEVVPATVVDQLNKIIDEKIDSIGELVAENERLKRRVGALGSEDPAEQTSD